MFSKVLVVDDVDIINLGTSTILRELKINSVDHACYCDEAYLKLKKALQEEAPYDLLVTDLSFVSDHRETNISSGPQLIEVVKKEMPHLKIIAFTVEDDLQTVKELWSSGLVAGYVCKGRKGSSELKKAIRACSKEQRFLSPQIELILKKRNTIILSNYDERLLKLLASGSTQDEIEAQFKKESRSPASRSSIEKRLKELRDDFGAKTTVHLVTLLKDFELI